MSEHHAEQSELALVVNLAPVTDRLPNPAVHPTLGLPQVTIDPRAASAAARVRRALDCALGLTAQHAGAFAA